MLAEASKKILRRMSYLSDQKGIVRRFSREKNNWNNHLENSKSFILKSIENYDKNSIAILGSGWCLDLPINELSTLYKKVYLIDIYHPFEIRKIARRKNNIHLVKADVTNGMIEFTYNYIKEIKKQKQEFKLGAFLNKIPPIILDNYDFVVSLNILNQLDILLIDYIEKYFTLSNEQINKIRKYIQDYHLDMLPKNKSCLIADYEDVVLDAKGCIKANKKTVFTQKINISNAEKWQWKFDTKKTYLDKYNLNFNVLAIKK